MVGEGARSQVLLVKYISEDTLSTVGPLEGVDDAVDWVGKSGVVYQIQNSFAQLVLWGGCADIVNPEDSIASLH